MVTQKVQVKLLYNDTATKDLQQKNNKRRKENLQQQNDIISAITIMFTCVIIKNTYRVLSYMYSMYVYYIRSYYVYKSSTFSTLLLTFKHSVLVVE